MVAWSDDVQAKVVRQLEFYFSDSNLPKDRFLKAKVAEDAAGYVLLRVVIAFARMREILKLEAGGPDHVPDDVVSKVAEVLKARSNALQVDETGTKLRRSQPLGNEEQVSREIEARTLCVRPFSYHVHMDQLMDFFSKHAPVNCVRMRRYPGNKAFRGSVFVEFASQEDMEKVLAKSLVYEGAPLRCEKKADYFKRKNEERDRHPDKKPHFEDDDFSNDELPDGLGGTVGGPLVPPEQAQAAPAVGAAAVKAEEGGQQQEAGGKGTKRAREAEEDADDEEDEEMEGGEDEQAGGNEEMAGGEAGAGGAQAGGFHLSKGVLLGFSVQEALPETGATRLVMDLFGGRGTVKFVELNQERTAGTIRFANTEAADKALADFNAKDADQQRIGPAAGSLRKVEGEEEEAYLARAKAAHESAQGKAAEGWRGGRGGRGGRGRGGYGGNKRARGRGRR